MNRSRTSLLTLLVASAISLVGCQIVPTTQPVHVQRDLTVDWPTRVYWSAPRSIQAAAPVAKPAVSVSAAPVAIPSPPHSIRSADPVKSAPTSIQSIAPAESTSVPTKTRSSPSADCLGDRC